MDEASLLAKLSTRSAPVWQLIDREDTVRWAFSEPGTTAALGEFPFAADMAERTRTSSTAETSNAREGALALAGAVIRRCVPAAARTAGEHWMLSEPDRHSSHLRLTVGRSCKRPAEWWGLG